MSTDIINLFLSLLLKFLMKKFNLICVIKDKKIIEPSNLISVVKMGVRSLFKKTNRDKRAAITAHNTERNEYIYFSNELLFITILESLSRR